MIAVLGVLGVVAMLAEQLSQLNGWLLVALSGTIPPQLGYGPRKALFVIEGRIAPR